MRKFGIKYSQLHPHSRAVRDAFVAVTHTDEWRAALERWYFRGFAWAPPGAGSERDGQLRSGLTADERGVREVV